MNSAKIVTLGINYQTAPIEKRQSFALDEQRTLDLLYDFKNTFLAKEAVVVSTCNRTELYLANPNMYNVMRWLRQHFSLVLTDYRKYSYSLFNFHSVQHLLRVASGLDSMVLGEVQILGQLKTAYKLSSRVGLCQGVLSRLFERSFSVAKKIRNETSLGDNAISVAYIAVSLVRRIFTNLNTTNILVVGAGDTARLVVMHLLSSGCDKIVIANRNTAKAKEMAFNIDPDFPFSFVGIDKIPHYIEYADIVVSMTTSTLPLIGKGMIESAILKRKHRPMVLLDLAIPRDIEPEVAKLSDVYLYNIDDLQKVAQKHRKDREQAAFVAENIISKQAVDFYKWLTAHEEVRLLRHFRQIYAKEQEASVQGALNRLELGHEPKVVLERMAYELRQKFLHRPSVAIRKAVIDNDKEMINKIKKLFLESETE